MTDYKCRQCGKELTWNGLYCSKECQNEAHEEWRNKLAVQEDVTTAVVTDSRSAIRDNSMVTSIRFCEECGKEFNRWDRSDKRFCDAKCRKRWNRSKHEAEKVCLDVKYHLNRLYHVLKKKAQSRTPEAINEMKRLRGELDYMLRMYDAQTMRERGERDELISGHFEKRDLRP